MSHIAVAEEDGSCRGAVLSGWMPQGVSKVRRTITGRWAECDGGSVCHSNNVGNTKVNEVDLDNVSMYEE